MGAINTLVQGVLLGGLYALFATGLSLTFGIMRLVNLAHGDFIVLAAFLALAAGQALGLPPITALAVVIPAMAGLGYALQRGLLNRTLGNDMLRPLLVTFGLSVIVQNLLLEGFSADSQKLQGGAWETASIGLGGGLFVGVYPLIVFALAVLVIGGLQLLFYRTELGRVFRATSDDRETVGLMGANNNHINAMAMAIAMGVVGLAGVLFAIRTNFDPAGGGSRLLFAFEAVIIGGLGNLWGTLAGGVVLGVAQAIGGAINPGWQILAGHIAFLIVLLVRPQGLFPRVAH